jgi:hypothetical protein
MNMKMISLVLIALLSALVAVGGAESNTVSMAATSLIAYLEGELSYPNEEKIELKIQKITKQMKLLEPVTNAESPEVWLYRHDKLEYLLGCLYLEVGDKEQAFRHLKLCYWNCGRYDTRAGKMLKQQFNKNDSIKVLENIGTNALNPQP